MSEPQTHADARAAIEELLDRIETDEWTVVEYDPSIDPDDPVAVTATIEREHYAFDADVVTGTSAEQRERIKTIKDVVASIEAEFEEGAHIDAVVDQCRDEFEMDAERVLGEIEKLRTKGEVYEPKSDYLRTT